jgi:hypothetical protein
LVGVGLDFFLSNFLKNGKLPVDLVAVGLDFFPLTILSSAIPAVDLVTVGLDFFPLTILSFAIPAMDLVGGVILFFPTCFLGTMVFESAFVVVISFFIVEDLGDGAVVGLGFFPTCFSLRVFLVSCLVGVDCAFFSEG